MRGRARYAWLAASGLIVLGACAGMPGSTPGMGFFVTSIGPGKGGDLGGIDGADRHCQSLAAAAGAGGRTWRAYLSTQGANLADTSAVNARDRIGTGPWHNAKGVLIARDVDELHSAKNNLTVETALDERGRPVNGRATPPNKHDMLTGSRPDGTAFPGPPFPDMTCGNWTRGGDGSAMTGHHDRAGPSDRALGGVVELGASDDRLRLEAHPSTGGDGLFYCFAAK